MKKLIFISAACLVLAAGSGCKSSHPLRTTYAADGTVIESTLVDAATELGEAYYNQANVSQLINAEGTNITWTISGCTKLVFNVPVPPKQIIPREQSWTDSVGETIKTVAPWLFMGYWIHEGGFGNTKTTTTTN